MNYFVTAVTHITTGTKTITCGFQPKGLRITASQRSTNLDNLVRQSVGMSDGTNQVCSSQFYDGSSGGGPLRYIDRIASVRNRVSGTVTEVHAAHVDQSVAAWTATEVKYIVDTADSSGYQYQVEVWGD